MGTGAKAGAIIGLFLGLNWNLWTMVMETRDIQTVILDVVLTVVMTAITGAVIGMVLGKLDSK